MKCCILFVISGLFFLIESVIAVEASPKFYAFRNGLAFGGAENEAKALKKLGYDGVSQVFRGGEHLAERMAIYEKQGLKVLSVYLDVKDKPLEVELVKPLAKKGALIELTIRKMTPQTVKAVRETVKMAKGLDIKVALYPHHGFAVATMPEAMNLIKKVNHPNLGVMFNLCHFLKNEDPKNLELILEKAGDHLFAVGLSGADAGGKSWEDLIKPLDQGSFPLKRVVKQLKKMKFKGPVGLQCYGVKGDKYKNLENSMEAWKALW